MQLLLPAALSTKQEIIDLISYLTEQNSNIGRYLEIGILIDKECMGKCIKILEKLILGFDLCYENIFGSDVFLAEMISFIDKVVDAEIKPFSLGYTQMLPYKYVFDLRHNLFSKLFVNPFREACSSIEETGVIHGMLSVDSPIDWNDNMLVELDKYIDIGGILCSDPATIAIKESLANLKQARQSSSYAVIVGPSLMGKTQTAFSLSHSMNLLYYNLHLGCDLDKSRTGETQTIYEPFRSLSILITKAIDLDMKHRDFSIHRMNAASFRSRAHSFYTLGFIYTYLKMRIIRGESSLKEWLHEVIQYEKAIIPAMTRGEFTQRISQGKNNKKHPFH